MRQLLLVIVSVLVAASTVDAQSSGTTAPSPAAPAKFFSYLKTDMRVGIKSIEGTASVTLHVYTEDEYELALATRNPAQALSIPRVKRKLSAYMKRNGLDDSAASRISLVPPFRTVFGRIDAIGDDYLLIGLDDTNTSEQDGKARRRRIIPKWSIGAIDLDADPVRFIAHPQRTRKQSDG